MKRCFRAFAALAVLVLTTSTAPADGRELFMLDADVGVSLSVLGGDNDVIELVEDFVKRSGAFITIRSIPGALVFRGRLDYLGIPNALALNARVDLLGDVNSLTLTTMAGTVQTFTGADEDEVYDKVEAWVKQDGSLEWAKFLQESNARSPLAMLSGNPRSSVALMGNSAYRKFGFDDSRSRMGFGKSVQRFGGFELRVDAGASSISTKQFDNDLWTVNPSITLAGDFGRTIGLSFSILGQYRDYDGAKMADLGLEIAVPITLKRPDKGATFWQVTPFLQAAGGASKDAAAGGFFMGGGLVNALGCHMGRFEILMANEIAYYNGIPINDIGGYDFETELSQLYFKNGLEGTMWLALGFYLDGGIHLTNFALDDAAVSWFVTPTVGVGWQAGRWIDLRLAYEADLDNDDYRAHNLELKLDFLF